MRLPFHTIPMTTFTINSISCILGILWWSIASQMHRSYRTITIPLCFYNTEQYTISAPETICITLAGKRSALRALNKQDIAAHIDTKALPSKKVVINLKEEHLLLPQSIKLISYIPSNLIVTLQKIPDKS